MWRKFWFWHAARSSRTEAGVYAPDVLLANWITPVQSARVNAAAWADSAPLVEELPTDAGAFLLRVYANQEC